MRPGHPLRDSRVLRAPLAKASPCGSKRQYNACIHLLPNKLVPFLRALPRHRLLAVPRRGLRPRPRRGCPPPAAVAAAPSCCCLSMPQGGCFTGFGAFSCLGKKASEARQARRAASCGQGGAVVGACVSTRSVVHMCPRKASLSIRQHSRARGFVAGERARHP